MFHTAVLWRSLMVVFGGWRGTDQTVDLIDRISCPEVFLFEGVYVSSQRSGTILSHWLLNVGPILGTSSPGAYDRREIVVGILDGAQRTWVNLAPVFILNRPKCSSHVLLIFACAKFSQAECLK